MLIRLSTNHPDIVQYLHTLQVLLIVVASFSAPYCLVALMVRSALTHCALWVTWGLYTALVSAGCIYKLSGLASGVSDVPTIIYYLCVALAALGFPLAISAVVLHRANVPALHRGMKLHVFARPLAFAWLAAIAVTPAATAGVFAVDYLFQRPA